MGDDGLHSPSDSSANASRPLAPATAAQEQPPAISPQQVPPVLQCEPRLGAVPHRPPRVWTAIVVGLGAPVGAMVATSAVLVVAMLMSMNLADLAQSEKVLQWVTEFGSKPLGLTVLVIPAQLAFLAIALGAAALSREPMASRLAIRRSVLPLWTYPLLMLATLAVGMFGGMMALLLPETRSEQLEMIFTALGAATGFSTILIVIVISIVPGIVEELVDRGYVQSRLLRRWPPALAIGFSAAVFALAHFDLVHSLSVLPLGIWFGIVAWRADSVVPSMIFHALNNGAGIVVAQTMMDDPAAVTEVPPLWMIGLAVLVLIAGIIVLIRYGGKTGRDDVEIGGIGADKLKV